MVSEAIEGLPEEFLQRLENVAVMVEDMPRPEHYRDAKRGRNVMLLGLYHGVPLTKRSPFAPLEYPDEITIFQKPLESICQSKEQLVKEIRRTVLHEIAHHFGISDPRLRELGY